MNLIDLVARKDKTTLARGADLPWQKSRWNGDLWRSIRIPHSPDPQIVLRSIHDVYSLSSRPMDVGWYVKGQGTVEVSIWNDRLLSSIKRQFGPEPSPIMLSWPLDGRLIGSHTTLRLHLDLAPGEEAELMVHKCLDRKPLLDLAKGDGVEVGPGPSPQVLPSHATRVTYVEEAPKERWETHYDKRNTRGAAAADFSNYYIGTADNLPKPDGSLDFVFSSHVFEHLANPIGHLLHWRRKLKDGGVILAVVPDLTGTKDVRATPSTVEEAEDELRRGVWVPTRDHYLRWAATRGGGNIDKLFADKISIHVHFYTAQAITDLLRHCVAHHGFSAYSLQAAPNHKDLHFCLWR